VRPVSVVVPTIGRREHLKACLHSIAACEPRPDEVLVVDQSQANEVAVLVREAGATLVRSQALGTGSATNLGLRKASHETVLVTHDDCTVATDWVGAAKRLAAAHPGCLVTGRVLADGDARAVPSTIDLPDTRDYSGELHCGVLYPNNMILPRSLALKLGGFDDRVLYAEDNDFCYRWLRAGWCLRYEPELVVRHRDWRTPRDLNRLYVRYYRGQGRLYAKHLAERDTAMLRFLWRDVRSAVRSLGARVFTGRPRWTDPRRGIPMGLIPGLVEGWRIFRSSATSPISRRAP
jgi:GT2 family glycosyltransferase